MLRMQSRMNQEYIQYCWWYKPCHSTHFKMTLIDGQWICGKTHMIGLSKSTMEKESKQMLERDSSLYEITKDLETLGYMMDLEYFKHRIYKFSKIHKLVNTISGVLPYIAPEVSIGEEYKNVANVFLFPFVAYDIIT
ncbi:hypothetical protein Glove_139g304 [Diversispora epigaea]|uniref:Protein kinase domain-containing protein n=1 Tax=Diversispora epigaea TaxID=1348612 RepID=A0A397IW20_9GLOM|nr:hypothetical protein Glove_139g304 [Diversispora epigaea]